MKSGTWSIEEWCDTQTPSSYDDILMVNDDAAVSAIAFLQRLNLTFLHPFCNVSSTIYHPYNLPGVPAQGPLLNHDHLETWYDVIVTIVAMVAPSLAAMMELWLRLFSSIIAPTAVLYMLYVELANNAGQAAITKTDRKFLSIICLLGVACSVILLTDNLYVYEYGPMYGGTLVGLSVPLSWSICNKHSLKRTRYGIIGILCLLIALVYDHRTGSINFGDPNDIPKSIDEGLYYNNSTRHASQIVNEWPESYREYTPVSTPWLPTGDGRTGIPFLVNAVSSPNWVRVWLPVADGEVVALDVAFPQRGYDTNQPVYLVLHGLNGGSNEEYVKDFTLRRTEGEGATVIVMVARGLMDLPIRGMNVFHGARWEDPHQAALAIRNAIVPGQLLAGVGYSMGAIILGNMVSRTGVECALDVAVAISGGLDTRYELDLPRAQRLWQPLLIKQLRDHFAIGKWGERVRQRLTKTQMKALMRTTYVTDFDRTAVVAYHGYRDLVHYYSEMSVLGDVPFPSDEYNGPSLPPIRRIHNVSIPFCVVHALDDPLVTWRTVAAVDGLMHPHNLTSRTGSGNLFLLLTKRGGHVGWPTGWLPNIDGWKWMSDISMSFVMAVSKVHAKNRENGAVKS